VIEKKELIKFKFYLILKEFVSKPSVKQASMVLGLSSYKVYFTPAIQKIFLSAVNPCKPIRLLPKF